MHKRNGVLQRDAIVGVSVTAQATAGNPKRHTPRRRAGPTSVDQQHRKEDACTAAWLGDCRLEVVKRCLPELVFIVRVCLGWFPALVPAYAFLTIPAMGDESCRYSPSTFLHTIRVPIMRLFSVSEIVACTCMLHRHPSAFTNP